ncbi:FAD-dependent oxidoreductase [Acidicapsa ligni]|uniref:FAD-dependent oxidoreductase n=1 Tax=Acidicapsa ligni TaxID=542300 RepID=UPI0021DF7C42|nr:FAD-dependent oxidoreductase [Acidicapsa ligni]
MAVLLASLLPIFGCGSYRFSPLQVTSGAIEDFGTVLPMTTSAARTVLLTNPGNIPLTIASIALTGDSAADFKFTSGCGATVPASGSCSVQVSFAPAVVGQQSASLVITDGALNSTQTVSLTGMGSSTAVVDVIVYGATPSGIMAAIEAAQHGKQVLLLEPTGHVGGMMTNGLGHSDSYATNAIGGLVKKFFGMVNTFYGAAPFSNRGQYFEPHVAEQIFNSMIAAYPAISVFLNESTASVQKQGSTITGMVTADGHTYHGKEYIDASYTGDLMAQAQVSYIVGRESSAQYGESLAGVANPMSFGGIKIEPYLTPGVPGSGLIPHVTATILGAPGSADDAVMAYGYRLCLSSDPNNQIPFAAPANYDPAEFELMGRKAVVDGSGFTLDSALGPAPIPNNKFDLDNVPGGFSTDEVGESFTYPDGSPEVRQAIEAEQKHYMQGMLYFLTTDSRIPVTVQNAVKGYGLCKDEFTDNGGWPRQLYVREARRMIGPYVETQNDLQLDTTITDSIGVGGYGADDHLNYMFNHNGSVYIEYNPGFVPPSYPISYRVLTPQAAEVSNLLVSVDVSASHMAYASLRIEMTYMVMGQAAGAAASLAIDAGTTVQNVDYGQLSTLLLGDGAVITPPQ